MRFLIVKTFHPASLCNKVSLIFNENQTGKLAEGSSKLCFKVVDRTDEVSNHTYGKATLTRFEEIFEEY
ncbi:hypothetical protein RK131_09180 [Streptococcus pneumoniae]|nr:hypothetical protein [Streptococcus pneumoniae]